MKRIYSMVLILCIAFSMVACHSKAPDPTIPPTIPTANPTEPTVAPTEPTEPEPIVFRQEAPFSKENVPEFMVLVSKKYSAEQLFRFFGEYDCYNDTPPGVFKETGIQFFSFEGHPQSFLMFDDKLYFVNYRNYQSKLFAGDAYYEAATNAIPYDYDGDGVKDLIISSWREYGGHYEDVITVFNPVSKTATVLYKKTHCNVDTCLYITESGDSGQSLFTVWYTQWERKWGEAKKLDEDKYITDRTLLSKTYTVTGIAGYLKTVDGSLQFVPYTE